MKYRFKVSVQAQCPCPKEVLKSGKLAVEQTLKKIPAAVLKRNLKKNGVCELALALVGSAHMRRLNKQFRGKNRPTDVLSFSRLPLGKNATADIGDVIVCWPVAKKQAKANGLSDFQEVQNLAVHGTLHLFGYDHELSAKDARVMFGLQEKIFHSLMASTGSKRAARREG